MHWQFSYWSQLDGSKICLFIKYIWLFILYILEENVASTWYTHLDILLHIYFQERHLWKLNKVELWMVWPCLETLEVMLEYSSGWRWCNYQIYLNMFTWNALKSSLKYWNNFFKLLFEICNYICIIVRSNND